MKTISILAAALIASTSATAFAHGNEARQEEQRDVIEQGRIDGSITWREGLKLRKQQAKIAHRRHELLSDGYLSRKDRRELHKLLDKAETAIVNEQNDSWRRLWWLPRVGK